MLFESLENRRLMAADAVATAGTLFVFGTSGNDSLMVMEKTEGPNGEAVAPGTVTVTDDQGIAIGDGEFAGIERVVISAGNGDDFIVMNLHGVDGAIVAGGGADQVYTTLTDGSVAAIATNAGEDVVYASVSNASLSLSTGADADYVNIAADPGATVTVDTAGGSDTIDTMAVGQGTSVQVSAGADNDFGSAYAQEGAHIVINAGAGDDGYNGENTDKQWFITADGVDAYVAFSGNAGNDYVYATGMNEGVVDVDGGDGNDNIFFDASGGSTLTLKGGKGDDVFITLSNVDGVGTRVIVDGGRDHDSLEAQQQTNGGTITVIRKTVEEQTFNG